MAHYQRAFLLLSGWVIVLVGAAFGLTYLLNIWPWMLTTPVVGLLLSIPLALWVYLPVPPLVKAGVFEGGTGIVVLGLWCILFLVGFGAYLLLHLPGTFLIPVMALVFVPVMVAARQWKAGAHG